MADRPPHQLQVRPQVKHSQQGGASASKVIAIITLLPVGGILLGISGITLVGTLIGLAVATPVFILFSPILVPASLVVGLAVAAVITSGAFGLTGLSSLSWFLNRLRPAISSVPEQLDYAKRRMQEMTAQMGQKTKEMGQVIEEKAQEGARTRLL